MFLKPDGKQWPTCSPHTPSSPFRSILHTATRMFFPKCKLNHVSPCPSSLLFHCGDLKVKSGILLSSLECRLAFVTASVEECGGLMPRGFGVLARRGDADPTGTLALGNSHGAVRKPRLHGEATGRCSEGQPSHTSRYSQH